MTPAMKISRGTSGGDRHGVGRRPAVKTNSGDRILGPDQVLDLRLRLPGGVLLPLRGPQWMAHLLLTRRTTTIQKDSSSIRKSLCDF